MQEESQSNSPFASCQAFNVTATAVCGLYLATHSTVVTLIGTVAASVLAGWALWLSHHHSEHSIAAGECR